MVDILLTQSQKKGSYILTNPKILSNDFSMFDQLIFSQQSHFYGYGATISGSPLFNIIQDLTHGGDRIQRVNTNFFF